jgi:septal ring factor EnvC (AmiA/AmiB activator)
VNDQTAFAVSQTADMKVGVAPIVTDTQNHVIFAQVFLKAAADAFGSIEQGGNPLEVQQFVELAGPAIAQHLQYMQKDPSRKAAFDALEAQFKQLSQMQNKLVQQNQQMMQQQQQQQQELQAKAAEQQSDFALKQEKMRSQMQLKAQNQQFQQKLKAMMAQQDISLKDATAASDIHRKTAQTKHDMSMAEMEVEEVED